MIKIRYRIADVNDSEALIELRLKMRKERDENLDEELLRRETRAFLQRNLEKGTHIAFICEEKNMIIGTVGVSLFEMLPTAKLTNGKVAKLMNMYVIPEFRNKGIGSEMLNVVLKYAEENGYFKIMLNSSPMGKKLYEKSGFTLIPNEYEYYLK